MVQVYIHDESPGMIDFGDAGRSQISMNVHLFPGKVKIVPK